MTNFDPKVLEEQLLALMKESGATYARIRTQSHKDDESIVVCVVDCAFPDRNRTVTGFWKVGDNITAGHILESIRLELMEDKKWNLTK